MRVLRAFESAGLEYVLIGAAAMGFHGLVRATEDLDLFIRATPENIEKLRSALRAAYEGDPHVGREALAHRKGWGFPLRC
jgi:predicted nucleotidyltransferase